MTDLRTSPKPASTPSPRLPALDGLRGFAAVIVVLWHASLTVSLLGEHIPMHLSDEFNQTGTDAAVGSLAWWVYETPLRVLTMGTNAVTIFFVLSGFVLVLPMLRGRQLNMWAYFPRRIARLWIPSAASVLLAGIVITLARQHEAQAETMWGRAFSYERIEPQSLVESFFLITGSDAYNNPLWSLRWELLFSLLLPVAFVMVLRVRRDMLWAAAIGCALLVSAGGALSVGALQYGPLFLAGGIAARIFFERPRTPAPWASWLLVLGGWVAISLPDMARTAFDWDIRVDYGAACKGFVAIGAVMVVLGLTSPSGITALFSSRPFRFLGRISFSLYLVHAPLIIGGVHFFPAWNAAQALLVTIPASFIIAWLFCRLIEEPSARLARHLGDTAAARIGAIPTGHR